LHGKSKSFEFCFCLNPAKRKHGAKPAEDVPEWDSLTPILDPFRRFLKNID